MATLGTPVAIVEIAIHGRPTIRKITPTKKIVRPRVSERPVPPPVARSAAWRRTPGGGYIRTTPLVGLRRMAEPLGPIEGFRRLGKPLEPRTPRAGLRRMAKPLGPIELGQPAPLPAARAPEAAAAQQFQVLRQQDVSSSWVRTLYLVMYNGEPRLAIRFKDGYTCLYPNSSSRDYGYAIAASSKGRYVWMSMYHRNKIPVSL